MAELFKSRELLFNTEASFGVNSSAVASNTYDSRVPFTDCTVSLEQPRESDMTVQSRKNETRPGYLGLRTARLEFSFQVPGIMSDPGAGAPTANWFYTLLSSGLGGALATDDGGTITSSTDGDTFVTTGVTAITAGSIIRVGIKADGRADGQPGAVATWAAGSTQLLTALPGTPTSATPDAVRTCLHAYPTETNPTVTLRFLATHRTTGAQYHIMGCQLENLSLEMDIATGRPVRGTMTYLGAYWDSSTVTVPSSITNPACDASPIAGGSFFINTFGTATRAIEQPSTINLSLRMGLRPYLGPSTTQPNYTNIYGWESEGCIPVLTYTIPWSSTKATEFDVDGSSTTHKHILWASNAQAGRCFGFYIRNAYPTGSKPVVTESNGLVYMTVQYTGRESSTVTSELTRTPVVFFCG